MRRTISCYLFLVLWSTLSLHQSSSASAGDLMPAGYCEYFSKADFISLDVRNPVLPKVELATVAGFVRTPVSDSVTAENATDVAPVVLAYLPKSARTWNFDYQPMKTQPVKTPRIKLLWHSQKVGFRPKTTATIKVRSQRKHVAPVLFWGKGSVTDMTITAKLITHQFSDLLYSGVFPVQQFPIRIVRMMKRLF